MKLWREGQCQLWLGKYTLIVNGIEKEKKKRTKLFSCRQKAATSLLPPHYPSVRAGGGQPEVTARVPATHRLGQIYPTLSRYIRFISIYQIHPKLWETKVTTSEKTRSRWRRLSPRRRKRRSPRRRRGWSSRRRQRPKKSELSGWQNSTRKNFPDELRKSFLRQKNA